MANLAIGGHPTRGREIISWLEMLGGENRFQREGNNERRFYYIDKNKRIQITGGAIGYILFTLEEFEKKFPYKVGDKVITTSNNVFRIKEMLWDNKEIVYSLAHGEGTLCWYNTAELRPYKEEDIEKIESINYNELEQQLDEISAKKPTESLNKWLDEEMKKEYKIGQNVTYRDGIDCMIFHSKIVDIKDGIYYLENRDEIKYENILNDIGDEPKAPILSNRYDYAEGKCGYVIPDGYEFDSIKQGFQTEIILRPIKPQYPKNYDECCDVLGVPNDERYVEVDNPVFQNKLIESFTELLICRNAYWKIASDWKYDVNKTEEYFYIVNKCDSVVKEHYMNFNHILAFPTEEMRDAFFENFKELIEQCKELL